MAFFSTFFNSVYSRLLGPPPVIEYYSSERYKPTVKDVLEVKADLLRKFAIPTELIDTIIDFAEYWPYTTTIRNGPTTSVRAGGDTENRFILRTFPLGFIPNWQDHSGYQITDQYEEKFPTLMPQPWPEERNVPNSCKEEVLREWAKISQPRGAHPCRKIVFTLLSHDQGWGGGQSIGHYDGSYTWFDVGKEELSAFREAVLLEAWEVAPWPQFRLYSSSHDPNSTTLPQQPVAPNPAPLVCSLRTVSPTCIEKEQSSTIESSGPAYKFHHDLIPDNYCLQKNITAERQAKEHVITWTWTDDIDPDSLEGDALSAGGRGRATANGEYLRNLSIGDSVTVWGKARFPGWINVIDSVKIDIYWAV